MGSMRNVSGLGSFPQAETPEIRTEYMHVTVTASRVLTRFLGSGHPFGSQPDSDTQPQKKMSQEPFLTSAGWSLNQLITRGPRFREIPRVSVSDQNLEVTIHQHETSA